MRPGTADTVPADGESASTDSSDGAQASEGAAGEGVAAAQPARPPGAPRRRRRRRRGPRPEGAAAGSAEAASGETAAASETGRPPGRSRFGRNRRPRREGEQGAGRTSREGDSRDRNRGQRSGGTAGERRDPRDRGEGRGRRSGPGGRGRDGPPRKVERKLYSMDAVVDRGFEDVEADGETKRVHWTIVKRTVADQISRKPVSASYVLQREGADSEFPTLGAARDAVNKTIVHPEKLTPSKSEIAALKGSSR